MSQSMMSVRCSACASATARLLDTSVFPSPGAVLVTTMDRAPSSADENTTAVRMARIASAKCGGAVGEDTSTGSPSLDSHRRHQAEERQAEVGLDLVRRS